MHATTRAFDRFGTVRLGASAPITARAPSACGTITVRSETATDTGTDTDTDTDDSTGSGAALEDNALYALAGGGVLLLVALAGT